MDTKMMQAVDAEKAERQVSEFKPSPAFATALIPKNFKEAMEMATVFSKSNVVPKDMVGRPESCFVAIGFGMELGLPPMQAIQNIMVVNGRPSIWGDAAHALVMGSGQVEEFEEDAPDVALKQGFGRCVVKLRGYPRVERRFSVDDAKRAKLWTKEGPWQTYPGRMLQMRARSWAERDAAPFILKGIQFREEMADIEVIHPPVRMPEAKKPPRIVQDAQLAGEIAPTPKQPIITHPAQSQEAQQGFYDPDATGDAQEPGNAPVDDFGAMKISEERRKELFRIRSKARIDLPTAKKWLSDRGMQDTSELTNDQAREFQLWIEAQNK